MWWRFFIKGAGREGVEDIKGETSSSSKRINAEQSIKTFGDLWRSLEEQAILIGLSLDYFWTLNPNQYNKYVKVFNEKEQNRVRENDRLNYLLGKYIGWAINDPKHYPKRPFLEEQKENELKPQTISDMEKMAMRNTLIMGGVINDSWWIASINHS